MKFSFTAVSRFTSLFLFDTLTHMSLVKTVIFPLAKHVSSLISHETCQLENNPIVPNNSVVSSLMLER